MLLFLFLVFFWYRSGKPPTLYVCEKQIISYNHQASLICIYANAKQSKWTERTWLQLNVANVSQRRAAASLAAVFRRASEAQETPGGSADAREARRHLLRSWLLSLDICCCSLKFFLGRGVGGALHERDYVHALILSLEEEIKRAILHQL